MKSETRSWLSVGLTYIGGYVDAVGYIVLASTFVAHMSGNTVRFGIAVAHAEWIAALFVGFPIPFFVLGAAVGAAIPARVRGVTLFGEAVLIAVFAFLASRVHLADAAYAPGLAAYIGPGALLVFALALQNAVIRQRGGGARGTTFVSGILANIGEFTTDAIGKTRRGDDDAQEARTKLRGHLAMFGGYLAGGVCGALAFLAWSLPAFAIPVFLLIVAGMADLRIPVAE